MIFLDALQHTFIWSYFGLVKVCVCPSVRACVHVCLCVYPWGYFAEKLFDLYKQKDC